MKRKTKLRSWILAIALVVSLCLTGCGGATDAASTAEADASGSTTTAVSQAAEVADTQSIAPAEGSEAEGAGAASQEVSTINYPLDTDVTLTLMDEFNSKQASDLFSTWDDSWFWSTAQEKTGVNIDFNIISSDSYSTQFNLIIASGDYPDLMGGFKQYYTGALDAAVEEGIITDVATLAEYCPDYMAVLKENNGAYLRNASTDTGVIGAFYTIDATPQTIDTGLYVRQDWLDKLNLDIPETLDDMTNVMKAFQSEENASQPLFAGENLAYAYVSAYDVNALYNSDGSIPLMAIDGKVVMTCLTDGFADALAMMHDWYTEGLISSDFSNQDDNSLMTSSAMSAAILNGESGFIFGSTNTVTDLEDQAKTIDADWSWNAMAAPVLESGQKLHAGSAPLASVDNNGYAISGTCENPDVAAMFLNFFYTDEGSLMRSFGEEGVTYEIGDDGVPYFLEYFYANDTYSRGQIMSNYFLASNTGLIYANRFASTKHARTTEFTDAWNSNYDFAYVLPSYYSLTTEENDSYDALLGDLTTALEENVLKFITGDRSIDEVSAFQDEMRQMGAEDLITVVQSAYDRYLER